MVSRSSLLLIFVLVCSVAVFGQTVPAGWVKLTSNAGRFSVIMPGPDLPEDKPSTTATAEKNPAAAPYTSHIFLKRSDKGIFMVGWTDYAPGYKPNSQGEMTANRDNFVKGQNATVTYEKAAKLGNISGIEFIAESAKYTFRSRVFMVGPRPYMVLAGTFAGMNDAANVERFLDSFQFTPAK